MHFDSITAEFVCGKDFHCLRPQGLAEKNLFVLFHTPAYVWQDGAYVSAPAGSCCLFRAGCHTEYYPDGGEFRHAFFHFSYTEEEGACFSSLRFGVVSRLRDCRVLDELLVLMQGEAACGSPNRAAALNALGQYFFWKLADETLPAPYSTALETRQRNLRVLRAEILSSPEKKWRVADAARKAFLSVPYFQHLYRAAFGATMTEELLEARMHRAETLLIYSSAPVSEIAERCGYGSTEQFIRRFRESRGVTPYRFRLQNGRV